jgi:hypothetical protein
VTVKNENAGSIFVYFADSSQKDYGFKVNLTIYQNNLSLNSGQNETDSIDFAWKQADACSYLGGSPAYRVKAKIAKNDSTVIFNSFLYPYDTLKIKDFNYDDHLCTDCINKAYDTIVVK